MLIAPRIGEIINGDVVTAVFGNDEINQWVDTRVASIDGQTVSRVIRYFQHRPQPGVDRLGPAMQDYALAATGVETVAGPRLPWQ